MILRQVFAKKWRDIGRNYKDKKVLCVLSKRLFDQAIVPYAQRALLSAGGNSVPLLLEQLGDPKNRATAGLILIKIGSASVGPLKAILLNPRDNLRRER